MVTEPVSFVPVRAAPTRSHPLRERLSAMLPQLVLTPSLVATFVYVFVFCGWTIWISVSNSTLMPDYSIAGFHHYAELWSNRRWSIAYNNLFLFSAFAPKLFGDHLSLSAGGFFRGDGHGLALATQPVDRNRERDSSTWLGEFQVRLADPARDGDLHCGSHRHLAGVRLCDGPVPGRSALGRS